MQKNFKRKKVTNKKVKTPKKRLVQVRMTAGEFPQWIKGVLSEMPTDFSLPLDQLRHQCLEQARAEVRAEGSKLEHEKKINEERERVKQLAVSEMKQSDTVNHPPHYNTGKIEVIEFIEDQKMPYHIGNVVKYLARAGKKDPRRTVEDLRKAQWYLARAIELEASGQQARDPVRPNEMTVTVG